MENPLISIIIPVYNTEKYLSECLDSVLAQSYKNWEAICINDGSKDNSLHILNDYANRDERIKVINQENKGLSETRNIGLEQVQGQYIMFLDSDDFWHSEILSILVNIIKKEECDIISFSYKKVLNGNFKQKNYKKPSKFKLYSNPLINFIKRKYKTTGVVWNKIYRADLIRGIKFVKINPGEDNIFVFECLGKSKKIAVIDNELYFYNQNPSSIMHTSQEQKIKQSKIIIAENIRRIIQNFAQDEKKYNLCNYYLHNRLIFRDRIIYILKKKTPIKEIIDEIKALEELKEDNFFDEKQLTLKNKIIWSLLLHKQYKLAKIFARFGG